MIFKILFFQVKNCGKDTHQVTASNNESSLVTYLVTIYSLDSLSGSSSAWGLQLGLWVEIPARERKYLPTVTVHIGNLNKTDYILVHY